MPVVFKGGSWVDEGLAQLAEPLVVIQDDVGSSPTTLSQNGGEGVPDRGDGDAPPALENYGQALYVTVIGGQKYDPDAFCDATARFLLRPFVVGCGRGIESDLAKSDGDTVVVQVDPDLFGKNARKVNVEQVLCFAPDSPLLLVGDGTRVKQARAWLDRTKSKREVIELP